MSEPAPRLPPYGLIPIGWLDPNEAEKPPKPWVGKVDYVSWLEAVSNLIGEILWPRYDAARSAWVGAARARMEQLTATDFRLFAELRPDFKKPVWDNRTETHETFFLFEDTEDYFTDNGRLAQDRSFDRTLREYFKNLRFDPMLQPIADRYDRIFFKYEEGVDLHLKRRLQRPRPHQVAFMLGVTDFNYERAGTATSPSMISGHSYESLIGGIGNYLDARTKGAEAVILDTIAQHAVDIGDRRVLAGVHYPSDNLSSWITVLSICPFLFPDSDARDWAWQAISGHSLVYRTIEQALHDAPCEAYRPAWEMLHRLGTCDLDDIQTILGL